MALSGSFSDIQNSIGVYCEWSGKQSVTGNYTVITVDTYLQYRSLDIGSRSGNVVNINGEKDTYTSSAIKDYSSSVHKKKIRTTQKTVYHNSDGTKSCSLSSLFYFKANFGSYGYRESNEARTTVTLDKIDRTAPTVSLSTSGITASDVTLSASANTTCDIWQYSLNGGSWVTFSTTSVTSVSYVLRNLSPATSYTITVRARKKSNAVYGNSAKKSFSTLGNSIINSANNFFADSETLSLVLSITVFDTSYSHVLSLKYNGQTLYSTSELNVSGGTKLYSFSLTEQKSNILSAMKNEKSIIASAELLTYDESVQIGKASTSPVQISVQSGISSPSFENTENILLVDSNTTTINITEDKTKLIQRFSELKVTGYNAIAKNGASISYYSVTVDSVEVKSPSESEIIFGNVLRSGEIDVTIKAVDSRGFLTTVIKTIEVYSYDNVKIVEWEAKRENNVGSNLKVKITASYPSVSGKNNLLYSRYRYAEASSESTFGEWIDFSANNANGRSVFETNALENNGEPVFFDPEKSYNIEFEYADALTVDKVTVFIPIGIPVVSIRNKKIGINTPNPQGALDVSGEIFNNGYPLIESGTWTPRLSSRKGTAAPTYTVDYRYGQYYKIGKLVFIAFHMKVNITNAGDGYAAVEGLPFASNGKSDGFGLSARETAGALAEHPARALIPNTSTQIWVQRASGANANKYTTGVLYIGFSGCYVTT